MVLLLLSLTQKLKELSVLEMCLFTFHPFSIGTFLWYTCVCSYVCAAMFTLCVQVPYVCVEVRSQGQVLSLSLSTIFFERIIAMGHHAPIFPWIPEI